MLWLFVSLIDINDRRLHLKITLKALQQQKKEPINDFLQDAGRINQRCLAVFRQCFDAEALLRADWKRLVIFNYRGRVLKLMKLLRFGQALTYLIHHHDNLS